MNHLAFPVEARHGKAIATGDFAGTASYWGGPAPRRSTINYFGENPLTTINKIEAGSSETVVFIVPAFALAKQPLYVTVAHTKLPLQLVDEDERGGYTIMTTTVHNKNFSSFSSSLLWLTLPSPRDIPAPIVIVRRDPTRSTSTAYVVTTGEIAKGSADGRVRASVSGSAVGTPVIAYTPARSAIAGFVEHEGHGTSDFVATSHVATMLRAALTAGQQVPPGTAQLGVHLETTAIARLRGDYIGTAAGALVSRVGTGSPAQQGGLTAGDVIIAFDSQGIYSSSGMIAAVRAEQAGTRHVLTVVDPSGKTRSLTVTLGRSQ